MGLFDFLHGGKLPKSDAEIYMEQVNRKYAQKAADYKRKDLQYMGTMDSLMDFFFGTKAERAEKEARRRTEQKINNNYSVLKTNQGQPQKHYQSSLSCNECTPTPIIPAYSNIFSVAQAMVREQSNTTTFSGTITKGGLQVGDTVTIIAGHDKYTATIHKIFRQGELITYANLASGKVAIVVSSVIKSVKQGDLICK